MRREWNFQGYPMRIFKWSSKFRTEMESSLVPVWVTLPKLPIHFFHKYALDSIASLFGKPLRVDEHTANFARPSFARVCVEVDLLGDMPNEIWIGDGDGEEEGFFQSVVYEHVPHYCTHCFHLGHNIEACFLLTPKNDNVENKQATHEDAYQGEDLRKILEKKRGKKPITEEDQQPKSVSTQGPLVISDKGTSSKHPHQYQEKRNQNVQVSSQPSQPDSEEIPPTVEPSRNLNSIEVVPQFYIQLDLDSNKPTSPTQQQNTSTDSSTKSKQCALAPPHLEHATESCQSADSYRQAKQRELAQLTQRYQEVEAKLNALSKVEATENREEPEIEEQDFEVVSSRRRRSLGSAKRITYARRGKSNSDGNPPKGCLA